MTEATEVSDNTESDSSELINRNFQRTRNGKRRRLQHSRAKATYTDVMPSFSFSPLLDVLNEGEAAADGSFDAFVETLLPDYLRDRASMQVKECETDETGQIFRPLTRYEVSKFIHELDSGKLVASSSPLGAIISRKLKLQRERRRAALPENYLKQSYKDPVSVLPPIRPKLASNAPVVDALYAIKTTPYEHSFLSRLTGVEEDDTIPVVAVDWQTNTPWMNLMCDIRDHYSIAHPEREQPFEVPAPIIYAPFRSCLLPQVHDMLHRAFWSGIDVSESLQKNPEKATVIATYKKLVVGLAFLSSSEETYITYLAVRSGWENSGIATTMLYQLIALNPHKDITLHVSANNSAMLLYNRFGFKAEEFVAGFYEDYVDPNSGVSKNAFRLRLRR